MDDEERLWTRIREVVRLLAEQQQVEIPNGLIVNTGSYWEREAQKREALNEFLAQIPEAPWLEFEQPLSEIADALDGFMLSNVDETETESDGAGE